MMLLSNWGRQASILGLPLGFALLLIAFFNIYGIYQFFTLLDIRYPFVSWLSLGTLKSNGFDFPRLFLILKMLSGVVWGCVGVVNIAIFRRAIWVSYICLALGFIYYCELALGLGYAVYAFATNKYIEAFQEYHRFHMYMFFKWPANFFFFFAVFLAADILIASIVLDVQWSYIKILQHGGSGWERKAYFDIHQSGGETVATLQAQWDARMGIKDLHEPELEKAVRRERLARDQENQPLIPQV